MSNFRTIEIPCSRPIKDETNLRFLSLGSNIKDNFLGVIFFILKIKIKIQNNIQNPNNIHFFCILEANMVNSFQNLHPLFQN
jgi:hypothetical protein